MSAATATRTPQPSRSGRPLVLGLWVLALLATLVSGRALVLDLLAPRTQPWVVLPDSSMLLGGGVRLGSVDAPLNIPVFWDYDCNGCRALGRRLRAAQRRRDGRLATTFHFLPLTGGVSARRTALFAYCASRFGAFESFHRQLIEAEVGLNERARFLVGSAASQVDSADFATCVKSPEAGALLAEDSLLAYRYSIQATPVFAIGTSVYVGTPRDLEELIDDALRALEDRPGR